MGNKKVDVRMEKLILRLRDQEKMTYLKIAEHVGLRRESIPKILKRVRNPVPLNKGGRPRATQKQ